MLSAETNRRLTEIGPGTEMGALLRRYWHPVAGVSEFDDVAIKPIRLFGEDLVLFKTLDGTFGLVARRCAHRGADLAIGIIEADGLRCQYHGWQYDCTGQCINQPFEEVVDPSARLRRGVKIPAYPVQAKAGMVWAYMGPSPAPLLPDWETFSWQNCFAQVVIAEIPCNWLQCQENTVDPVHFEWMHNNGPQRRGGDFSAYSPETQDLRIDGFEYGLISRRYRQGGSEDSPLWSVGRAILWPNGWYFGHHFEWKVPIDDGNTLFVNWFILHVPKECEPYVQARIPTWYAPTKDEKGRWIDSHVGNQDILAWVSQGQIADRTHEYLGASDRGVVALRRQLLRDLDAIAEGRDPKGIIRDPAQNHCIQLPCVARGDQMNGLPRAEMMKHPEIGPFLRDFYSMAGQPDAVRAEFEAAMGTSQSGLAIHKLVFE
jgi:5,5'-dehydrodivanillate O-demethylase oxygenase subunit